MMPSATPRSRRPTLAELNEQSTLAEIVFALKNADQSVSHSGTLDAQFAARPDYMCWRAFYNMAVIDRTYRDEWFSEAVACGKQALGHTNEMIRWGAIGTITRTLLTDNADELFEKYSETLLNIAEWCASLARHPNRWHEAPAGCAYLDLMSRLAFSKLRDWDGKPHTVASAEAHLDDVEARVREIDDQWKPGDTVRLLTALRGERMIAPFDGITDIENQLAMCFYISRVIVGNACKSDASLPPHEAVIGRLLKRAMHLARSSWLTLRAGRLGADKRVAEWTAGGKTPTGWFASNPRETALNIELKALHAYACAQRDAGDDFGAAGSNWKLLAFASGVGTQNAALRKRMEEWFVRKIRKPLQDSCEQVGLTAPGRAPREKRQPKDAGSPESFCPMYPTMNNGEGARRREEPYARRLRWDYSTDRDWEVLKNFLGPPADVDPQDVLKNAKAWWSGFCARSFTDHPPPSMLQAAFRLCLRYNRIDDANYYLKPDARGLGTRNGCEAHGWEIQASELLDFAAAVCHATVILPIALDFDKHEWWRKRMLRVCAGLKDELTPEQSLLLHEAVHGCCNALCARSPIADELCKHFELDDSAVFDRSDRALRGSWCPPDPGQIGRFLRSHAISGRDPPVAVSIASLRERGLSICAVGPEGHCVLEWIEGVNDEGCKEELAKALECCDTAGTFISGRCPGVVRVARKVAEMVDALAPNAGWIALSVDTGLASVPWNLLMPRLECHAPVAVVPSLGWLGVLRQRRNVVPTFVRSPRDALVLDRYGGAEVQSIDALLGQIEKDEVAHRQTCFDVATIVGHGCQSGIDAGAFQTVRIGAVAMNAEWWLDRAAKHDVLIVHGCLTGLVGQKLLRDLSGVPGMALLAGASLVVSPVVEIGADAALVLQRHIMTTPVSGTIAERYQQARKECPSVGLYNLYGVPTRPLA